MHSSDPELGNAASGSYSHVMWDKAKAERRFFGLWEEEAALEHPLAMSYFKNKQANTT